MSSISAGITSGSALVNTADTTGNLVFQVNGTTPAITLNTTQSIGVGSSPSYGTSGQVLTSAGSAAPPTWTTPAAGAMTFLGTVTASAASSVVFGTSLFTSTYDTYQVIFDTTVSSAGAVINATFPIALSASYCLASTAAGNATILSGGALCYHANSTDRVTGNILITNMVNSTGTPSFIGQSGYTLTTGYGMTAGPVTSSFYGRTSTTSSALTFTLAPDSGTLTGTFRLYGIAKA